MKDKIILYLGGGSMSGVFTLGVLNELQKLDFYKNIEAIFTASVGTLNGAYFLTKQSELGSTVYFEDLKDNFIFPHRFFSGFFQRLWNAYFRKKKEKINDLINIDHLWNIVKNKKPLKINKLREQNIPLYVKLLNLNTGKIEYLDARKGDILKILKASVSIVPYYFSSEKINGQEYIDGAIKEAIGLKNFFEQYPNNKIVIILNAELKKSVKHSLIRFLEASAARTFEKSLFEAFMNVDDLTRKDIELAQKNKERVLIVCPSKNNPTIQRTTDIGKLKITFEMGKKAANKIKQFL